MTYTTKMVDGVSVPLSAAGSAAARAWRPHLSAATGSIRRRERIDNPSGISVFARIDVARQVHGIVQDAQDLYDLFVARRLDPEHDEVTRPRPETGYMQCQNPARQIVTDPDASHRRSLLQGIKRRQQGFRINVRLILAETLRRPLQNLVEVGFSGRGKTDPPELLRAAHRCLARPRPFLTAAFATFLR